MERSDQKRCEKYRTWGGLQRIGNKCIERWWEICLSV